MRSALAVLAVLLVASIGSAGEGVLEINQVCAVQTGCFDGDTPGFPVVISAPGSYRLTSNLDPGTTGIEIAAPRVTIDLAGFWINRASSHPAVLTSEDSVAVVNGNVRGGLYLEGKYSRLENVRVESDLPYLLEMGDFCVMSKSRLSSAYTHPYGGIHGGSSCHVVDNLIIGAAYDLAIWVGPGSTVSNNTIESFFPARGILAGANSLVSGNVIRGGALGISSSSSVVVDNIVTGVRGGTEEPSIGMGISCSSCVVDRNVITDCSKHGISAGATTGYSRNHLNGNNGGNANPQVSGGIDLGGNVCGGDTTCP